MRNSGSASLRSTRTTPQITVARAAAAQAQDLVAFADRLARQVEEPRRGEARSARETVAVAVRDERQIARAQPTGRRAVDLEPALPQRHGVEHQARIEARQRQRPRRRELRAAIERAGHPQAVKGFTERVDGGGIGHHGQYPRAPMPRPDRCG
jgi:hypothetical protein